MGAGGVIVPPDSYFPKLREICDRYEVLLIADEVITGFGRTGRWFALGHWGVEPDIVSFAKGVTSGYLPLGGMIVSKRVHDAILDAPLDRRYMHAATYCGHPVCCAVGLRNVEIIESEGLVERAAVMGRRLLDGLQQELGDLPNVGDMRGLGMMCGVELVDRQGHQGAGARARGQGDARGDGARPAGARPPRQRRSADRRHDLPVAAARRPRQEECWTASRRSCASRSSPRRSEHRWPAASAEFRSRHPAKAGTHFSAARCSISICWRDGAARDVVHRNDR